MSKTSPTRHVTISPSNPAHAHFKHTPLAQSPHFFNCSRRNPCIFPVMDPSPSGISIAGEDDSLVSPSPEFGNFTCSPLKIPGYRTPRIPRPPKSGITGIDAPRNSPLSRCNKENLNSINVKSGAPNLSVEPQTMKKRKKGGGYSLRKSLAWNRAFFTDEGVLNSSELSIVSGISSKIDMDELSSICEDETELMQINSNSIGGLGGLKSLEQDLFKELPCSHPSEQETTTLPQKKVPQDNSCKESTTLTNHPPAALKKVKVLMVTANKAHEPSELGQAKVVNGTQKLGIPSHQLSDGAASSKAVPVQATKPSGLRMPSPSLKFFSETNAPPAKNLPHGKIQATKARTGVAKSSISIASDVEPSDYSHELKMPHETGGSSKQADHVMSMNDNVAPQSTGASSGSSKLTSHEKGPRCENSDSVKTKVLYKMNNRLQMQDSFNDPSKKYLESELVSLKDELTYADDNKLASSDLESKGDHHKSPVELPRFQHYEDLMRENSNVCLEASPVVKPQGVEVPSKDGQNDSSFRNNGLRTDSQIEDMVASYGQWTSTASSPSSIAIRNLHAEDNAPKSDENTNVLHLSSERNLAEGASASGASEPMGHGIAIEEATVDTSNNAVDNLSLRSYTADSNTPREHSRQGEVERLHFDDGYDSLKIRDELTTKSYVANKQSPEPIEDYNSSQSKTEPELSCEGKQSSGKAQEDGTENFNVFPEVTSIRGSGLVESLMVNHMSESFCFEHIPFATHSQCLQTAENLQEQGKQQELQNESLDSAVLNKCSPIEILNTGDSDQKAAISDEASEAQVYEAPASGLETDTSDGPCSSLAINQQGDSTVFSPKNVLPSSPLSGSVSNDQDTSSVFHPSVGMPCSQNQGHFSEDTAAFEPQMTVNKLGISALPTAATESTSQCHVPNEESANELQGMPCMEEGNAEMTTKTSGVDVKRGGLVIKVPTNAVPFSDEWLAAIEAAGEEILTSKGGRVQNSPPDKPLPEPSPWSPVKRKTTQVLGPYDCTKITNNRH
ncbi:hypothetical protein Droror1_Dr00017403 [Drosera rotundifolia]